MEEPVLLLIETSTESCSVALAKGGKIISRRLTTTPRLHASILAPYIQEVLLESGIDIKDCSAIAVSEGPGSYTGLRVGVSTAKGLCFGVGKPLIGINTLQILAMQGIGAADKIVPMIDARRMEVYSAVFDSSCHQESDTEAIILEKESFCELLDHNTVLFIGNGVAKFQAITDHPNAKFCNCYPDAAAMLIPATESLQKKEFKDVAYFEPFYLKEFVAGISKKSLL